MTNLINNGLLQAQQSKRNESIERVEWAVQFLKDTEGVHAKITAVKIADISGLSRVVLYKAHLRKIWDVSFNSNHSVNGATYEHMHLEKQLKDLQEQILQLDLKLQKKEQQLARSVKNLEKEKQRAQVYREDYEELKERHQRLLHYNLRILRKLHIHGVDTSDLGELHNEFEKSKGDKSYK